MENKSLESIFDKYNKLSQKNQKKALNEIRKIIKKYCDVQKQEDKEIICSEEGHQFSDWKQIEYTYEKKNPYYGSRDYVSSHEKEYTFEEGIIWGRTCLRCGYKETHKSEPKELKEARKEKNRKEKIKKLEKELERLKKTNHND